jgi:YqaJ-like viral recombinase domain
MVLPTGHPLLDRIVADAALDPAGWGGARPHHIGASDAAAYSKLESVERYARRKLTEGAVPFRGSSHSQNGHTYEPALMEWAGLAHNARMFAHPDQPWRTATPDGVGVTPTGVIVNGEAKVKHHIVRGPDLSERRQVVWAQHVTGAEFTRWVWLHVHPEKHHPVGDPKLLTIDYDPDLLGPLLTIADAVWDIVREARQIEQETP